MALVVLGAAASRRWPTAAGRRSRRQGRADAGGRHRPGARGRRATGRSRALAPAASSTRQRVSTARPGSASLLQPPHPRACASAVGSTAAAGRAAAPRRSSPDSRPGPTASRSAPSAGSAAPARSPASAGCWSSRSRSRSSRVRVASAPLYPGAAPSPLPVSLRNPNAVPIFVTAVQVAVSADPAGCDSATNFELTPGRGLQPRRHCGCSAGGSVEPARPAPSRRRRSPSATFRSTRTPVRARACRSPSRGRRTDEAAVAIRPRRGPARVVLVALSASALAFFSAFGRGDRLGRGRANSRHRRSPP